jgi:hypothetical protein
MAVHQDPGRHAKAPQPCWRDCNGLTLMRRMRFFDDERHCA